MNTHEINEGTQTRVSSALAFLDAEVLEFERGGRKWRVEFSTRYAVARVGGIILDYGAMPGEASFSKLLRLLDLTKLVIDSHDALRDHMATRH